MMPAVWRALSAAERVDFGASVMAPPYPPLSFGIVRIGGVQNGGHYAVALSRRRAIMEQTQKQRMLAGQLYHASDPEIQADQQSAKVWMVRYNAAFGATADERRELLRERL